MDTTDQDELYRRFEAEWNNPATDHITVRTSGSTGTPKEIRLPKSVMERSARRTCRLFGIGPASRLHSCVGLQYIGGKMMMLRGWLAGCHVTHEQPSNHPLRDHTERLDLVSVVPSQMEDIVRRSRRPDVAAYLIGGSAISPQLRADIAAAGIEAWESYGMTETASHIAVRRVTPEETPFHPLPGIEVGIDGRGCLTVRELPAPGMPETDLLTVVTNDMAELTPDGGFTIKGRADDMIVTGGRKVHPADIERSLRPYLRQPFRIGSRSDRKWTDVIVLGIVGDEEEARGALERIRELPEDVLPRWQRPKEAIALRELPMTAAGKPSRRFTDSCPET